MRKNLSFLGFKIFIKSLILAVFVTFSVLTPIAQAQGEGTGVAGFSECSFQGTTQEGSNEAIQKCIAQILRFAFIVGIFVALFRIAFVAFNSSNPFFGGGTSADMVKVLRDFAIGAFILGAPVVVLNTINPNLLNINFLGGVLDLAGNQGNNSGSNNSGNGTEISSTISGSNANVNGTKPNDLQTAINNFNTDPTNTDAQNKIKEILLAEKTCQQPFVKNYDTCKSLEDAGFKEAIANIPQSARETLGSNIETPSSFDSPVTATENFKIGSGVANPTPDGCTKYGLRYTLDSAPSNGLASVDRTLVIKKCDNRISELFKRGPNGTLIVDEKNFKAGDQITEDIVEIIN